MIRVTIMNEIRVEKLYTVLQGDFSIDEYKEACSQLKELSLAIKKALECNSIEELLPLEEAIIPKTQRIGGGIRKKWNIPQQQEPKQEYVPDTTNTRAKWNKT